MSIQVSLNQEIVSFQPQREVAAPCLLPAFVQVCCYHPPAGWCMLALYMFVQGGSPPPRCPLSVGVEIEQQTPFLSCTQTRSQYFVVIELTSGNSPHVSHASDCCCNNQHHHLCVLFVRGIYTVQGVGSTQIILLFFHCQTWIIFQRHHSTFSEMFIFLLPHNEKGWLLEDLVSRQIKLFFYFFIKS